MAQQPHSGLNRFTAAVSRSYTQPVGLLWTSDQLVAEAATRTIHNKQMKRKSVPSAGFELATPATERPQTYALDRTALRINILYLIIRLHNLNVLHESFQKFSSFLSATCPAHPRLHELIDLSLLTKPKFAKPVVVWWSPVAARFISSAQRQDIRGKFWHRHCCLICAPPLLYHVRTATAVSCAHRHCCIMCEPPLLYNVRTATAVSCAHRHRDSSTRRRNRTDTQKITTGEQF